MKPDNQERRKTVLIDKQFQLKLILQFITLNTVFIAVSCLLFYIFLDSELQAGLLSAHNAFESVREMLLPVIISVSIVAFLFSAVFIWVIILYSSHKVAGPLYRLHDNLKKLAEGRPEEIISARNDDQLKELNRLVIDLAEQMKKD